MDKMFCINHPEKKALSFCHNCKEYFCKDCLVEGLTYYYCKKSECNSYIEKENLEYKKSYVTNP